MVYTTEQLELLFDIQAVAMRAGLPIIFCALKHFPEYPETGVGRGKILKDIIEDEALKKAGYVISNKMLIDDAINNLIDRNFLREDKDKIILDEKGKKAITILIVKKAQ